MWVFVVPLCEKSGNFLAKNWYCRFFKKLVLFVFSCYPKNIVLCNGIELMGASQNYQIQLSTQNLDQFWVCIRQFAPQYFIFSFPNAQIVPLIHSIRIIIYFWWTSNLAFLLNFRPMILGDLTLSFNVVKVIKLWSKTQTESHGKKKQSLC